MCPSTVKCYFVLSSGSHPNGIVFFWPFLTLKHLLPFASAINHPYENHTQQYVLVYYLEIYRCQERAANKNLKWVSSGKTALMRNEVNAKAEVEDAPKDQHFLLKILSTSLFFN